MCQQSAKKIKKHFNNHEPSIFSKDLCSISRKIERCFPMNAHHQTALLLMSKAKQNQKSSSRRFFLVDVYHRLRDTSFYLHWSRLLTLFRRLRVVTLTVRIFSFFFAVLQTGTLVLLSATVLLVVVPLLLTSALVILLCAAIAAHRTNQILAQKLTGQRVCILFPTRLDSPFLIQHIMDMRERGYVLVLVSPHLFSPTGTWKRRFYTTAREERAMVFLVRRYYYFSLKKRVLAKLDTVYQF